MPQLTIVASIAAKPEKIDLVKTELTKLIATTKSEPGCIQYDLHQDNHNPAQFLFFEIWETYQLWQQHMNADHLSQFKIATDGAIETLNVAEMTRLD